MHAKTAWDQTQCSRPAHGARTFPALKSNSHGANPSHPSLIIQLVHPSCQISQERYFSLKGASGHIIPDEFYKRQEHIPFLGGCTTPHIYYVSGQSQWTSSKFITCLETGRLSAHPALTDSQHVMPTLFVLLPVIGMPLPNWGILELSILGHNKESVFCCPFYI